MKDCKKFKLIAISAVSVDGVIGIDNEIPWYIPEDFQHFKNTTINNAVLIGYNTYLTLPQKALENRTYLVLNDNMCDEDTQNNDNIYFFKSFGDAIIHIDEKKYENVYVAGGAGIYESLIQYCDEAIITWVNKTYPNGNKKFPINYLFENFEIISDDNVWHQSKNNYLYKIIKYGKY